MNSIKAKLSYCSKVDGWTDDEPIKTCKKVQHVFNFLFLKCLDFVMHVYKSVIITQANNVVRTFILNARPLLSWLYDRWIYNYVCNQCLFTKNVPLTLWVRIPLMVRCSWYNIMWENLSVTCGRSGFSPIKLTTTI